MKIPSDLFTQLQRLFSTDLPDPQIQQKVNALLASQFKKMDVVSREEFAAQSAVLEKTRLKLEQLEKQLSELEK